MCDAPPLSQIMIVDLATRRVTREELRAVFDRPPFRVIAIEAAAMATNLRGGRKAWFARVERLADSEGRSTDK